MYEIRELSGQEYVDEYATKKAEVAAGRDRSQIATEGHGRRSPARRQRLDAADARPTAARPSSRRPRSA